MFAASSSLPLEGFDAYTSAANAQARATHLPHKSPFPPCMHMQARSQKQSYRSLVLLSWNASTAGKMEIIEYLEELVELTKLLVGVNAFRSGVLEKPKYITVVS